MKAETYRSISGIDRAKWDAIVEKGRIFSSHRYIDLLERSGVNKDRCYYVVVYDNGAIAAHACLYYTEEEVDLFARGPVKELINKARQRWKNFFMLRTLESGPPAALGSMLSIGRGHGDAEAFHLLCRETELLAKKLGVKFILFRDFYDDETRICGLLGSRGYQKMHNLPKAEINIRWKSFDEYLDSMRSSYRSKMIKGMEKFAKAGMSVVRLKDIAANAGELKRLHDNVSGQAKEIKREPVPESFFRDIGAFLGEKAAVLAAVKDGKMAGFMLTLFNDDELISATIGLDYDCNRECFVYFNLFYETIRLAIESGMKRIDMGITALNPKRDMGSDIKALNMYMKHVNPFFNRAIPVLFDMITPPDTTAPRNVFKDK